MGLRFCTDLSAAHWLVESPTPAMQLISLGPAGYETYARLRFIPDPGGPGQAEADVDVPEDHPSDIAQSRRALHLLARFTATPQECYFCLWEGYSDMELPAAVQSGPLVDLPHRRYALLHGSLTDIDSWQTHLGLGGPCAPPAFAWPADRSWCFVSDVDPHWAGIGADRVAIDLLRNTPDLDVVLANPEEHQPTYY